MSVGLLRQLRLLEADYFAQPPMARGADLREINQLRSRLGMPPVDARLHTTTAAAEEVARPEPKAVPDHTEARGIYEAYLKKIAELAPHRAYAERVAEATAGHGQTPVRPLATMGTGGGPLLCDHCGKPIVLEGGHFHGAYADAAWKRNPDENWASWILGGMVVEIQTNGTLRIYHGYPGRNDNQCCNVASRQDKEARAEFQSRKGPETMRKLLAFLEHEFRDITTEKRLELLDEILGTVYGYDPGFGVNRPSSAG
jgi:hypothetical protein